MERSRPGLRKNNRINMYGPQNAARFLLTLKFGKGILKDNEQMY